MLVENFCVLFPSYNNFVNKMGACAGCMGPSRRDQNYKVNRLTENAPIKNRISSSQLPIHKYQMRVVAQLHDQKKKIEQNNLISTLIGSSQNTSPAKVNQRGLSSSTILYREPNEPLFLRESYYNNSTMLPKLRKSQSAFVDQNSLGMYSSSGFERKSPELRYSVDARPPAVSEFRLSSFPKETGKVPLNEVGLNKNGDFGKYIKGKELLNIPQLPQEQSKTPHYVREMRKQNGEDVLRTGLQGVPRNLEGAPSANLFKYLKDLQ